MNLPSYTSRSNLDLIDSLYQQWKESPESVDASWRAFFEGFELAQGRNGAAAPVARAAAGAGGVDHLRQSKVSSLIYAYRSIGHTQAHLDPLSPAPAPG